MRTRLLFTLIVLAALAIAIQPVLAVDYNQYQGNFTAMEMGTHSFDMPSTTTDTARNQSFLLFADIGFYKNAPFQIYEYFNIASGCSIVRDTPLATVNASSENVVFRDYAIPPATLLDKASLGTGTIAYQIDLHNSMQIIISIASWNIGTRTGDRTIILDYNYSKFRVSCTAVSESGEQNLTYEKNVWLTYAYNVAYGPYSPVNVGTWGNPHSVMIYYDQYWKNHYRYDNSSVFDQIWVDRQYEDGEYTSTISLEGIVGGITQYFTISDYGTKNYYFGSIPSAVQSLHLTVEDQYGDTHNAYWNIAPASACNLTAAVQNIEDGNVVRGATFKVWDITKNTWQSFVLSEGIGSASIPYLGDTYAFNATKTGYTGYDADPPEGIVLDECPDRIIYTYLSGPPSVAGNSTVHFFVTNPDALAIDNAQVCLDNGMCQATNLAGTATFPLLIIGQDYNHTVTKSNYYGVHGAFTGAAEPQIINVILTQGVQPTATVTSTPGSTNINDEIQKLVDTIATQIYAMGILLWYTAFFTVIGMFFLAIRSIGGGGRPSKGIWGNSLWGNKKRR
jgi:hypothetical protein